jgi:hypothetical protein
MKKHRKECDAWLSRDKKAVQVARMKATMLERHGVENPMQSEEIRAKAEATNQERYGAPNPFAREASTYQKVQDSLVGKRHVAYGSDNHFSKPEVQAKIRATMKERYGAENPQQVAEIRERTEKTNQERYGGTLMASPELREKARKTNLKRYGNAFPQRTEEVKERIKETNMRRYGVPWTGMDPDIRRRQLETHHERYGSHFFASDEGKEAIRSTMKERYGVEFPGAIEGHWDKAVETFKERYGVEHPLQLAEFLEKQQATLVERYGTPFPGLRDRGMNGLEGTVFAMAPEGSLLFTGDGMWWRKLPLLGANKNPDFIVPGPDPENPKKGVTKVVEAFGDYWHSRIFTGKAPFDHEQELIDAYAEVGLECLILWESEVKYEPEHAKQRLLDFLGVEPAQAEDSEGPSVFDLFGE